MAGKYSPIRVTDCLSYNLTRMTTRPRNLALSLAAGNATLWKPSPTTPLTSIATTKIIASVLEKNGIPGAVAGLVIGDKDVGEALVESEHVDLGMVLLLCPLYSRYELNGSNCNSELYRQRACWSPSRKGRPIEVRQSLAGTWW